MRLCWHKSEWYSIFQMHLTILKNLNIKTHSRTLVQIFDNFIRRNLRIFFSKSGGKSLKFLRHGVDDTGWMRCEVDFLYANVLLSSASMTESHRLGALKNRYRYFSSHSPGSWKCKIRVPAWSGSDESSLPFLQTITFLCVLTWQRERLKETVSSLLSTYKGH